MPPSDSTFYSYGQLEGDVFAAIRRETYGEDLGQFSWITIQNAGFVDLHVEDVTDTIAAISKRWHDAREKRRTQLLQIEKSSEFETLQGMLAARPHVGERATPFSLCLHRSKTPAG